MVFRSKSHVTKQKTDLSAKWWFEIRMCQFPWPAKLDDDKERRTRKWTVSYGHHMQWRLIRNDVMHRTPIFLFYMISTVGFGHPFSNFDGSKHTQFCLIFLFFVGFITIFGFFKSHFFTSWIVSLRDSSCVLGFFFLPHGIFTGQGFIFLWIFFQGYFFIFFLAFFFHGIFPKNFYFFNFFFNFFIYIFFQFFFLIFW